MKRGVSGKSTDKIVAFDDQTSTFIIPAGSGFEVVFCPGGRSTNILATEKNLLSSLSNTGHTKRDVLDSGILDVAPPDFSHIPLVKLGNVTLQDQASYQAHKEPKEPISKAADDTENVEGETLYDASMLYMWSQRHRWAGDGKLTDPDLDQVQKRHVHRHTRHGASWKLGVQSGAGRHFVRQERMRSGFYLGLGMLVGFVAAWSTW